MPSPCSPLLEPFILSIPFIPVLPPNDGSAYNSSSAAVNSTTNGTTNATTNGTGNGTAPLIFVAGTTLPLQVASAVPLPLLQGVTLNAVINGTATTYPVIVSPLTMVTNVSVVPTIWIATLGASFIEKVRAPGSIKAGLLLDSVHVCMGGKAAGPKQAQT